MRKSTSAVGVVAVIALGVILMFASCATIESRTWKDRTYQEKALAFMQMYNAQYDDTMRLANIPNPSAEMILLIQQKKEILTKVKPLIELYEYLAGNSMVPDPELESEIVGLLDLLIQGGLK